MRGEVVAGKYRLVEVLGEGGMGAVWLAVNIVLDVEVALKLIRREIAGAADSARRLLHEARAAACIDHASIVRVFDYGETEHGDPFLVMERLQGESLANVLADAGRLAPATAVRILLPVASALAAAHTHGIVHRDLKPDNILLVEDETGVIVPKLVDFGIAKFLHRDVEGTTTLAGTIVGSPDYMSPEQARGEPYIDARSDVWALGVVLYELVTGELPFRGRNHPASLRAVLEDEAKPVTSFGNGDDAFWQILEHALEKDITRRWPTMRAFGVALANWALEHDVPTDVSGTAIAALWQSGGDAIASITRRSSRPRLIERLSCITPLSAPRSSLGSLSEPTLRSAQAPFSSPAPAPEPKSLTPVERSVVTPPPQTTSRSRASRAVAAVAFAAALVISIGQLTAPRARVAASSLGQASLAVDRQVTAWTARLECDPPLERVLHPTEATPAAPSAAPNAPSANVQSQPPSDKSNADALPSRAEPMLGVGPATRQAPDNAASTSEGAKPATAPARLGTARASRPGSASTSAPSESGATKEADDDPHGPASPTEPARGADPRARDSDVGF